MGFGRHQNAAVSFEYERGGAHGGFFLLGLFLLLEVDTVALIPEEDGSTVFLKRIYLYLCLNEKKKKILKF